VFKTRELIQELLKNVPSERAALQKAGETLDRKTNGDWVASSLARKIQEKGSKCHVIVDSVRIKKQIDGLRRAFGSRVVHIHLTADPAILRKRVNLPS
jgi:adenylosuccinate synthase